MKTLVLASLAVLGLGIAGASAADHPARSDACVASSGLPTPDTTKKSQVADIHKPWPGQAKPFDVSGAKTAPEAGKPIHVAGCE